MTGRGGSRARQESAEGRAAGREKNRPQTPRAALLFMDALENERQKRMDERFERNRKDLEKLEEKQEECDSRSRKLEELNIKMGEILKNQEDKLNNHDKRIDRLESVSSSRWNQLVNYLLAGAAGALAAAAMRLLIGG